VLDVGCGIGRCLDFVRPRGVGVDPNESAVEVCRQRGLEAFTPEEFAGSPAATRQYDSLLCAHVVEHLDEDTAAELLTRYLPLLAPSGRVVLITPQERGQRSDATHVRFMDEPALRALAARCGLEIAEMSSFPLPRAFGRWFIYNETVTLARVARP
jgi:2-polyprenyl-3-methyl-5-hydroxy-6-metoxy-1,4-benzoquinol methylase